MIDICLLGCGGMLPLEDRNLTAMLFRHNGKMILTDCGEGTQVQIRKAGWGFKAIDLLCFTHWHADHVAGLPGFLLTLGNHGRTEPLTVLGPPGIEAVFQGLTVIVPVLPYEVLLMEVPTDRQFSYTVGDITVRTFPLEHWVPCLGYRFDLPRAGKFDHERALAAGVPMPLWGILQKGEPAEHAGVCYTPEMVMGESRRGISVSYCVDTRPVVGLSEFVKDSDLLICEGMYGDDDHLNKAIEKKHMLFSEAALLAQDAGARELWLTHFSPALEKPEEFLETATNIFENTAIGTDMKFKSLKFED